MSVGVYPASLLPYSSAVASSRILVHLPALRSHPGSILSGDERVFIFGGGGVLGLGFGLCYTYPGSASSTRWASWEKTPSSIKLSRTNRWCTRANSGNWDWWGANADSDPWRGGWGRREGVTRNEVHGACGGTCRLAWPPRGATIPHHASREPSFLQVPTLIFIMVRSMQCSGGSDG